MVVEDDPAIGEPLRTGLEREGFQVNLVTNGADALAAPAADLVLLDLGLPDLDGREVCRRLRTRSAVPIIVVSARGEEIDRVLLLELGADDYVVKPFSPRELAARVNGVLRRTSQRETTSPQQIEFDGLSIDPLAREVRLDGEIIDMTPKEFDVLAFLASSPRQVFSRAQLLEQVWQSSPEWQDPATVTVHVRRIRNKIEADPETPRWISTVWGVGYRFEG